MIFIADYAHHQELESIIKVVAACGILVVWFSSCRYGVELRVVCPVCGLSKAEWRRSSSAPCLTGGKKILRAVRVSKLLKSRASPDMLPFSLCNKKRLAIRHMNRPLFPTTLSIPSCHRAKDLSAHPQITRHFK